MKQTYPKKDDMGYIIEPSPSEFIQIVQSYIWRWHVKFGFMTTHYRWLGQFDDAANQKQAWLNRYGIERPNHPNTKVLYTVDTQNLLDACKRDFGKEFDELKLACVISQLVEQGQLAPAPGAGWYWIGKNYPRWFT